MNELTVLQGRRDRDGLVSTLTLNHLDAKTYELAPHIVEGNWTLKTHIYISTVALRYSPHQDSAS